MAHSYCESEHVRMAEAHGLNSDAERRQTTSMGVFGINGRCVLGKLVEGRMFKNMESFADHALNYLATAKSLGMHFATESDSFEAVGTVQRQ